MSRPPRLSDEYYKRRKLKQDRDRRNNDPYSFDTVFSRPNLYKTIVSLRESGGQAPGSDDIRYSDISPQNTGLLAEVLSRLITDGSYIPASTRPVRIPKSRPGEFRRLQIPTISDRIVSAALQAALQPLWEQIFLDGSWGFRTDRSSLGMLARMDAATKRTGQWIVTIDDVASAFDNVAVGRVMEAMRFLFQDPTFAVLGDDADRFLSIAETVLRGHSDNDIGIGQGNPYSPTALNVLLHVAHDTPLGKSGHNWFRYADNLAYLSQDTAGGHQVLDYCRSLLRDVGLALRGGTIVDLTVDVLPDLLGFTVARQDDGIRLHVADSAWDKLRTKLSDAHESPFPVATARNAVQGWVAAHGAAFENTEEFLRPILVLVSAYGFRELSPDTPVQGWRKACNRWDSLRREAFASPS